MFQCVSGAAVRRVFSLSAALLVSACSTVATTTAPSPAPAPASPFTGFFKNFSTCRSEFDAIEARIAEAGVREASFHVVPGFAYLRTDRMLASFAHEVKSLEEVGGYLTRPLDNKRNLQVVVNAAIENGLYVIIDYHAHAAERDTQAAVAFFSEMAERYGKPISGFTK